MSAPRLGQTAPERSRPRSHGGKEKLAAAGARRLPRIALPRRLPQPLARLAFYYPLTLPGTVLLVLGLYLLGIGWAARNPYALLLAVTALAVLLVLSVLGRLQAIRLGGAELDWDSSPALTAREPSRDQRLVGRTPRTLPFFRAHFRLRGRLRVGRGAFLHVAKEVAVEGEGRGALRQALPLLLPVCGIMNASGRFLVRDVFGLTGSRFGEQMQRALTVRPASFGSRVTAAVQPAFGEEDQSRRKSQEEEKYFMREYMPGDRFRDINWKVSSRLDELITRISPLSQEKTSLVEVELRNYRRERPESLESVAHLNLLKSWLLAFLRRMKAQEQGIQFRIRSGSGTVMVTDEQELERFQRDLGGLFFQGDPYGGQLEVAAGELFVFSTPFDHGLAGLLAGHPGVRFHVFRTAFPRGDASWAGREEELPLLAPLSAEVWPGRWALRREGDGHPAAVPPGGTLEDLPLKVRMV